MRFVTRPYLKLAAALGRHTSISLSGIAASCIFCGFTLAACSPGFTALNISSLASSESYTGGAGSIHINWNQNREAAVNSAGGGYRVFYTQNSSLTASAPAQDVPYSTGSAAPTSTTIDGLVSGTYHVYVVAYSALKSAGSAPSVAATVVIK